MGVKDDGGFAFPVGYPYSELGMTMRDYFAAAALPAVVGLIGVPDGGPDELWNEEVAEKAHGIADAMLEARKNK